MLPRLATFLIAAVVVARVAAPLGQQAARNPLASNADAVTAGQRLYAQTCQSCHGPSGQGDRGPALNTGRFTHGNQDSDLFRTIRSGVPGTQMPPFARLSDEQTWQLVTYIRDLATSAPFGPSTGPPRVTVAVQTKDGREIRGTRLNEDTFSVQLVDESGAWLFFDKATREASRVDPGGVTSARLEKASAEPENWLMYWGDYQATHYSGLSQIDTRNVHQLRAAWTFSLPGEAVLEATPVVIDGVMYMSQPGVVVALDARTGRQLWRFTRQQKVKNPNEINPFNRGVAVAGNRVFVGTLDAALLALDARTGQLLWETQVADSMLGHSLTSAPLVVKDKVLVGITGGEFGARGFLDAYDLANGRRLWRWYSVPAPGEFGNETWKGDSWKLGGSPMWLTGSYDPGLNLVYWTVGNPGPQIDRSVRGDLDNLFSDSVVAIDPDTGQRKWHYQFTPNDGHDWDSCQAVVLVDRLWHGQMRKLLLHADRNGFFYVLDRTDGTFLAATPFAYQNWNSGFDPRGRPIMVTGSNSSRDGSFFVYPSLGGATNFQAPSFSPVTGLLYLEYRESGQAYISSDAVYEAGREYIGRPAPSRAAAGGAGARGAAGATGAAGAAAQPKSGEPAPSSGIKALDLETGKTQWDFKLFQGSLTTGVLATAGNVVFGAVRDGNILALDAKTGAHLWHFQTGTSLAASPMSYSVDGHQFVGIGAGNTVYTFALPE
ncbi:MAG TPA: PQQ-dependent dehydrogenase, methanol/ethanol family [Vicinamibacterales bacterium]|nr:PQQ-dependent dehydrogenase, methanol/ethanol family [Vicinamibacterales bacterium]